MIKICETQRAPKCVKKFKRGIDKHFSGFNANVTEISDSCTAVENERPSFPQKASKTVLSFVSNMHNIKASHPLVSNIHTHTLADQPLSGCFNSHLYPAFSNLDRRDYANAKINFQLQIPEFYQIFFYFQSHFSFLRLSEEKHTFLVVRRGSVEERKTLVFF